MGITYFCYFIDLVHNTLTFSINLLIARSLCAGLLVVSAGFVQVPVLQKDRKQYCISDYLTNIKFYSKKIYQGIFIRPIFLTDRNVNKFNLKNEFCYKNIYFLDCFQQKKTNSKMKLELQPESKIHRIFLMFKSVN
jgi:hypothetical protein